MKAAAAMTTKRKFVISKPSIFNPTHLLNKFEIL